MEVGWGVWRLKKDWEKHKRKRTWSCVRKAVCWAAQRASSPFYGTQLKRFRTGKRCLLREHQNFRQSLCQLRGSLGMERGVVHILRVTTTGLTRASEGQTFLQGLRL